MTKQLEWESRGDKSHLAQKQTSNGLVTYVITQYGSLDRQRMLTASFPRDDQFVVVTTAFESSSLLEVQNAAQEHYDKLMESSDG